MSDRDWGVLRNLAEKATQGEWTAEPNTGAGRVWVQRAPMHHGKDCEPLFNIRDLGTKRNEEERRAAYAQREADALFIAAASPGVVKELIEENEGLREYVREYEGAITWGTSCLACSQVLDSSIRDFERADRAEAERDAALAVIERVRAMCDEAENPTWPPRGITINGTPFPANVSVDAVRSALTAAVVPTTETSE